MNKKSGYAKSTKQPSVVIIIATSIRIGASEILLALVLLLSFKGKNALTIIGRNMKNLQF